METWQVVLLGIISTVTIALLGFAIKTAFWAGGVDSDRDSCKDFMGEIRDKITQIFDRLGKIEGGLDLSYAKGKSPLILNELGKKISKEIDAEKWAEDLFSEANNEVGGMTHYEIQEFCNNFVGGQDFNDEQTKKLQNAAYNHGVSTFVPIGVLALVLRDKLIESLDEPS